ncbi:MAG: hypothetical protein AVDCRST_MAG85-605, partial [uncultured Solirubrobacteraceae bacterium]
AAARPLVSGAPPVRPADPVAAQRARRAPGPAVGRLAGARAARSRPRAARRAAPRRTRRYRRAGRAVVQPAGGGRAR